MTVYFVNGETKHFNVYDGVIEKDNCLIIKKSGHGVGKVIIIPFSNVLYFERD
jgi:hypothetical protein